MAIKILSFIALFPILYVVKKILKRKELNSFDIILSFHTLYFAAIPLQAKTNLIMYREVRDNFEIQMASFIFYMLFVFLLLFIDIRFSQKTSKPNLFYLGEYTRNFTKTVNLTNNFSFYIILAGTIFIYYAMSYLMYSTMAMGYMNYDDMHDYLFQNQSPMTIFIKSFETTIRLYITFILSCAILQYKMKGEKLPTKWKILSFFVVLYYFFISRTYLFEAFVLFSFIYYACRREKITTSLLVRTVVCAVLIIGIVFPFITAFRSTKKRMMYNDDVSTTEILIASVESVFSGGKNIENLDNKEERSLNVYQIFARCVGYGKSHYGELSAASVSHGMPKALMPSKSKFGSQEIIEQEIGNGNDVADSVLLHFQMESQYLGFLLSNLFFLMIISIYNKIMKECRRIKIVYLSPFFVAVIFPWLDRCEYGVDGFTSGIFQNMLQLIVLALVLKVLTFFVSPNNVGVAKG